MNLNQHMMNGVDIPVHCVRSHLVDKVNWQDMNVYIVESVHIPAVCVISHSVNRAL